MDDVRLIDAKKAQEYFYEHLDDLYMAAAMNAINEMPTIEAEPVKHGHWINHFDDLFPEESTIECSVCHEHSPADMPHDNFCPHCGADMRGT